MSSLILRTGTRAVFHTILLFSIYMLFAGHNAPGGGFIGGLIAASGLVLRSLAEGPTGLKGILPVEAETVMGVGALFATLTGVAGFAIDGAFLASGTIDLHPPFLGDIHVGSVLFFDIGVYLVVVGLVGTFLTTLGTEREGTT